MKLTGKIYRWLGTDGLLHVLCSTLIVVVAGMFLPIWASVVIAIAVGIAKEIVWDRMMGRGDASWHDLTCDIIGVALGVAVLLLDLLLM